MHTKGFRWQFLYSNVHLLLETEIAQLSAVPLKFSLPEAGSIYKSFSLVLWLVKIHHLLVFQHALLKTRYKTFWLSALAFSPWNSQLLKYGANPFCSQLNRFWGYTYFKHGVQNAKLAVFLSYNMQQRLILCSVFPSSMVRNPFKNSYNRHYNKPENHRKYLLTITEI